MTYKLNGTLDEFESRLKAVLPDFQEWYTTDSLSEIKRILASVLRDPIVFPDDSDLPSDTFWWFHGSSSLDILGYEFKSDNHLVLHQITGGEELAVTSLTAYRSRYERDIMFVYLQSEALPPFLKRPMRKESLLYVSETDTYLDFSHEDRVPAETTEYRTRHTAPYNVFIATKEGRVNNTGKGNGLILDAACDDLLTGKKTLHDFVRLLEAMPYNRFYRRLLNKASSS